MDSMIEKKYYKALDEYDNKNFEQAFDIFFDLARDTIKNNNREAVRMLGWCCLKLDKYEDGIDYLNKAIKMDSVDAIVDIASFYDLGEYHFEINQEKALELYTKGCFLGSKGGCRSLFSLLKEMNYDKIDYIQKHIGLFRFSKCILNKKLFNILEFLFKKRGL